MGLKKAVVTFTKRNGETVSREVSIKDVVFRYGKREIETIYEVYPDGAAQAKGGIPALFSQTVPMDLTNPEDITMLFSVSDRLWQINADAPLIEDFTELDGNGKMVRQMKTLNELGAVIMDVEVDYDRNTEK